MEFVPTGTVAILSLFLVSDYDSRAPIPGSYVDRSAAFVVGSVHIYVLIIE